MNKLCKSREGEENVNYQGLKMIIKQYNSSSDVIVVFENGYEKCSRYDHFKDGQIKNPFAPTVYGVGITGDMPTTIDGKNTKEYRKWLAVLSRSYSDDFKSKNPTYKDVTCCEEWLYYPNFYKWIHSQENFEVFYFNNESLEIDKDILAKGNKIYSPETCCLVPKRVNELFTKRNKSRGDFPIGVVWSDSHKSFRSQCWDCTTNKHIMHRGFKTPEEAFYQYKIDKENVIKKVAIEEYINNRITQRCYDAMMSYQVEITD